MNQTELPECEKINKKEPSKNAQMTQKQAERLEFLMQALTKMSRLETNLVTVQPEKQSVEPLIFQAVAQIKPKAEACEIDVKIQGNQKITACYDKKWSIEALYNLLDNAVKYSPKGSQVTLHVQEYSMYCEICVEDRGIGMTEEEIPKVFQRFYRKSNHSREKVPGFPCFFPKINTGTENLSKVLDLRNFLERISCYTKDSKGKLSFFALGRK